LEFTKPRLSYDQQADQLLARGLQGDRECLIAHLKSVSYYRLSGYWYPFRKSDSKDFRIKFDDFRPGATVEEVWIFTCSIASSV
jgi:abortive infection bacteriophage resistance protein